jgi:hypothetical protein
MYEPESSQKRFWTFRNEENLMTLRQQHNQEFIEKHGAGMNVKYKT